MTVTTLLFLFTTGQVAPDWNAATVRSHIQQAQFAAQQQDPKARDEGLLRLAAQAYKVERLPSESVQLFAKRVLRTRDPKHHAVKKDQWLLALANRLYADFSTRCKNLARNQQRKRDRAWFAENAKAFDGYARTIAGMLRLKVPGVEAEIEPLALARGLTSRVVGIEVTVLGDGISIEQNRRISFPENQPPPDANRSARGSLMSLLNSLKQHQIFGKLMAKSKRKKNPNLGKVRLFVPQKKPALYLNELLRAAKEAKYKIAYVMTFMPKTRKLAHIPVMLRKPTRKERKRFKIKKAQCRDEETMQSCAEYLADQIAEKTKRKSVRLYWD
ncbi:MAG: hypothetical protein VYC39_00545 [Myxococcota bacterium]|nr:hypothetical protein [Myxococcota bacterium]